jgi:hypothetical protein
LGRVEYLSGAEIWRLTEQGMPKRKSSFHVPKGDLTLSEYLHDGAYGERESKKPKKKDLHDCVSKLEDIVYCRFLTYKEMVGEENTQINKMNRLMQEKRENPGVECGLMVLMDEPNNPSVHAGSCIADLKDAEAYLNAYNDTLIETISTLRINRQMMNQTIAALEAEEDLIDGTQDESEDDEFEDDNAEVEEDDEENDEEEDLIDGTQDESEDDEFEDDNAEVEEDDEENDEENDKLQEDQAHEETALAKAGTRVWREESDLWKRAAEREGDVNKRMAKEIADLQEQLRNNKAVSLNANVDADAAQKEIADLQKRLRNEKAASLNANKDADAAQKEIADLQEQLRNEKAASLNANKDADAAQKEIADLQRQLCVLPEIDILTPTCDAHKDRPDPEKSEIDSQFNLDTANQLKRLSAWMKREMKKKKMSCCSLNCVANADYPLFHNRENEGTILNMSTKSLNDTCRTCCRDPAIPVVDGIFGFDGELIRQACHIAGTEK